MTATSLRSAIFAAALITPAFATQLKADDTVIARIGDTEIKADQLRPYLSNLSDADRDALAGSPQLLGQAVRTLILQQILFKEALAAGWDKNPDIAAQLERVRQGAIAESYLASVAKVPDGFPTDADVQAAYDARKDQLQIPKQLLISQIFIAAPQGDKSAEDKAKTRADAVAKSAKAPNADFASIARDKSEERESASRGGTVGWVAEASLQPEIRSKISGLPKGGVTDVIRMPDGWYIIKISDVRDAHTATLDEVRDRLVALLRSDRLRQNRDAYISRIQQQTPIAIDEISLPKLLKN